MYFQISVCPKLKVPVISFVLIRTPHIVSSFC